MRIKYAAKKPFDRANIINGGLESLGYPVNTFLEKFEMAMTPRMISILSRILQPPKVMYGRSKIMQPRDGQWNMKDVQVVQPCAPIKSWGVLVTSSTRDEPKVKGKAFASFLDGY
jgi:eukaryotic translation initiation factor 2C